MIKEARPWRAMLSKRLFEPIGSGF